MVAPPVLFVGWIDDAAMFPPGNAAVGEAVGAHLATRLLVRPLIGPLVVSDLQARGSRPDPFPGSVGWRDPRAMPLAVSRGEHQRSRRVSQPDRPAD